MKTIIAQTSTETQTAMTRSPITKLLVKKYQNKTLPQTDILDPIQAYMGDKADMNKANEVRPIFRRLAEVAERTGCAVILIGHLNKER